MGNEPIDWGSLLEHPGTKPAGDGAPGNVAPAPGGTPAGGAALDGAPAGDAAAGGTPAPASSPDGDGTSATRIVVPDVRAYAFQQAGQCDAMPYYLRAGIARIFHGQVTQAGDHATQLEQVAARLDAARVRKADCQRQIADYDRRIGERAQGGDEAHAKLLAGPAASAPPSELFRFWFESFVALMLTAYLFVFYVNAGYNAFIYQPSAERVARGGSAMAATAVVNPAAFRVALHSSASAFLLLCPFVFITLGLLLHRFKKERKIGGIVSVFAFALLFDALLAHEIVRKIYEARYALGLVKTHWTLTTAFSDMTFYLILFAGYLVYITWGLLFGSVLDGIDRISPKRIATQQLRERIASERAEEKRLREEREGVVKQRDAIEVEMETLRGAFGKFHELANAFLQGWLKYIVGRWDHDPAEQARRSTEANQVHAKTIEELLGRS